MAMLVPALYRISIAMKISEDLTHPQWLNQADSKNWYSQLKIRLKIEQVIILPQKKQLASLKPESWKAENTSGVAFSLPPCNSNHFQKTISSTTGRAL